MGADRVARLAERLRTGAHYDDECFQQFIFFPLPNGQWEMLAGTAKQYHAELWRQKGRAKMAKAWKVEDTTIPWALDEGLIATGYVDFKNVGIREVPYLVLPDPLPPGWTEGMVKRQLNCGSKIHIIEWDANRSPNPEMVSRYVDMIKRAL